MSAFGGLLLTNRGRNLQSKAQAGIKLQYTRIALGDGNLGSTPIADLNALRNEKKSLNITKLNVLTGGRAVVGSTLSNQDMNEGFYFRELGVFALDPDVGEVLYCYANAGPLAEYIPPAGGADIIEKSIDVQTLLGNAQNVTAEIDESLIFATVQSVENAKVEAKNYTNLTKEQLELKLEALQLKLGETENLDTVTKTNLVAAINEVLTALAAHSADDTSHVRYGLVTNANAKVVTLTPAPTNLVAGFALSFKNITANTGAVTLNVNGLGAKPVVKSNGAALASGNLKAGSVYTVRYDGSNFFLQGEGGEYGTAVAGDVLIGKSIGTEAGIVNGTLSLTGTAADADVLAGKTYYNTDAKTKRTGTLIPGPKKASGVLNSSNSLIAFTLFNGSSENLYYLDLLFADLGFEPSIIYGFTQQKNYGTNNLFVWTKENYYDNGTFFSNAMASAKNYRAPKLADRYRIPINFSNVPQIWIAVE